MSNEFLVGATLSRAGTCVAVRLGIAAYIGAAAARVMIAWTTTANAIALSILLRHGAADRSLIRKLANQLARYGRAEFTTNADAYWPAHT